MVAPRSESFDQRFLRKQLVACDHLFEQLRGSSALVFTGGCFPRPESASRTRSRLPCQRALFPRVPERILPSSFRRYGATPCPGFRLSASPVHRLDAARNQNAGRKGRSPRGCRRSPRLRSKMVSGRIDAHFENHLWPCWHLGPEGRCTLKQCGPKRGTIQQTRQSGEPRACSGRLRPSRVPWPAVVGGFEDSWRPATGAR